MTRHPISYLGCVGVWSQACSKEHEPMCKRAAAPAARAKEPPMKINFSNVLAIASLTIWATAWAATETKASPAKKPVVEHVQTLGETIAKN